METFSALLAICAGNSPVPGEFPSQRPVTRSFDVFFDLRLNKRLSKQPWGCWFDTPSWSLWRQCNETACYDNYFRIWRIPRWLVAQMLITDALNRKYYSPMASSIHSNCMCLYISFIFIENGNIYCLNGLAVVILWINTGALSSPRLGLSQWEDMLHM